MVVTLPTVTMTPPESVPASPPPHDNDVSAPDAVAPAPSPSLSIPCRRPVRLLLSAFLGLATVVILAWGVVPGWLDPTFEQHIQDKNVIVGMTREQTMQAWGSPYQMNVTYTNRGIRREEWVYEDWIDAGSVQHRRLYFEEGVLVGGWY